MAAKRKKSKYQRCVGAKLRGKHFRTKTAQRKALKRAANACRSKASGKKRRRARAKHRVHHRRSSLVSYNKCVQKCQRKTGHSRLGFAWDETGVHKYEL